MQLSYKGLVLATRFERATSASAGLRSIQLSYTSLGEDEGVEPSRLVTPGRFQGGVPHQWQTLLVAEMPGFEPGGL